MLSLHHVGAAQIFLIDFENRNVTLRDEFFLKAKINFTRSKFPFERKSARFKSAVFLKLTYFAIYEKIIQKYRNILTISL